MPTQEELQKIFYKAIEMEGKEPEVSVGMDNQIVEVTTLLANAMDEMGLTIAPVLAMAEVNNDKS